MGAIIGDDIWTTIGNHSPFPYKHRGVKWDTTARRQRLCDLKPQSSKTFGSKENRVSGFILLKRYITIKTYTHNNYIGCRVKGV